MSSGPQSTNAARPPLDNADLWVVGPDLHLGFTQRVREAWRYRRILIFFGLKAIQSLYANTKLGIWWLLIRPLTPVVVGTLVFGRIMEAPSDGIPYFLFFLSGSIVWSFFAEPLTRASRGLDVNRQLLTKLYVPRMILPAGQLAAGLIEPLVLTMVFAIAVGYYRMTTGHWYGGELSRIPLAIGSALLAFAFAFAVSLWTSLWQARARDVRYVLAYVMTFWFFLTPIVYPISAIPPHVRWLVQLNPMAGPVEAFRWALFGIGTPALGMLALALGAMAVVLAGGLWYFAATESGTVDTL